MKTQEINSLIPAKAKEGKHMHKNIYLSVAYLKDHPGRKGIKLLKRVYMQDDKKRDIIRFFISMRKKKLKSSKGEGYERS